MTTCSQEKLIERPYDGSCFAPHRSRCGKPANAMTGPGEAGGIQETR
ncbi:hypothetical protein QF030_000408 [Streptomyces rishiriensis]|uniref:Uncharacterized protein n=1 Tax=Streptomyces rishiriensis TaxID=68264 RepID=A0ABU0NI30_STRRH|nr:hypothetical protein [Streptomyces rishiriensis]MDR6980877.1 hypothetical protein [Streptomyces sp. 3330]